MNKCIFYHSLIHIPFGVPLPRAKLLVIRIRVNMHNNSYDHSNKFVQTSEFTKH